MVAPRQTSGVEVHLSEDTARWNQESCAKYFGKVKEYYEMLASRSILRKIRDFIFGEIQFHDICYPSGR